MRLLDDTPLDPEIESALEAIEATLAGEPVAPDHAAMAELALLLNAERARPPGEFARALDERVARRFAPAQPAERASRRLRHWWLWTPAAGLAAAVAVAIVIVVAGSHPVPVESASSAGGARASAAPARSLAQSKAPSDKASSLAATSAAPAGGAAGAALAPLPNGRKTIQGAQLSLTTNPSRIDTVAQEVFVVVGQVRGIVKSSTVTATGGPGGYAQFQLSIPSGSMPQAMAALSALRYAKVASRTDTTQDVNNQYQNDVAKVGSDKAVRASILKQLAAATTQGEIDSLTIRLHDINATLASDQATLQSLTNQINYSQVTLTINGGVIAVPSHSSNGGFTLHQAVHDAGRVLTVAAGVALIGLAALVPIALVVALGWWIAVAIRRRRREQALDLV